MARPLILFCACDRHNLSDLLFPHVAQALLPGREGVVAGLAERDLRGFGGHRVRVLRRLAAEGVLDGADLLHAGGELLTCTARQAAAMLLGPDEITPTLAYLERHPEAEADWRRAMLGSAAAMPYVVSRADWPGLGRVLFDAVGGVGLDGLDAQDRAAVVTRLAAADAVTVRDTATLKHLQAAGIGASLLPDPAVMVEALFAPAIGARAVAPPVAALLDAFPQGWIAVQLAADFGDDATLAAVASQLDAIAAETGHGLVLFRAGAAPWHDDAILPRRLAARLTVTAVRLFESLDVWDLCALLAQARAVVGSSLHARIVAAAFGVPGVGVRRPREAGQGAKLAAVASTWEPAADARIWPAECLAQALRSALASDPAARRERAAGWVTAYRAGFARLMQAGV